MKEWIDFPMNGISLINHSFWKKERNKGIDTKYTKNMFKELLHFFVILK